MQPQHGWWLQQLPARHFAWRPAWDAAPLQHPAPRMVPAPPRPSTSCFPAAGRIRPSASAACVWSGGQLVRIHQLQPLAPAAAPHCSPSQLQEWAGITLLRCSQCSTEWYPASYCHHSTLTLLSLSWPLSRSSPSVPSTGFPGFQLSLLLQISPDPPQSRVVVGQTKGESYTAAAALRAGGLKQRQPHGR